MRKLLAPRGQAIRYILLAFLATVILSFLFNSRRPSSGGTPFPESASTGNKAKSPQAQPSHLPPFRSKPEFEVHPIDHLIREARQSHVDAVQRQPANLKEAAAVYRQKRGRHPPPGFDEWYKYAQEHDALVVEEFFDRIYHDLGPFWALPAREIRIQSNSYIQVIRVRNGKASYQTDNPNREPWIQLWHKLIQEAAPFLPDVDVPINYMDETRVLVPWEIIWDYVRVAEANKQMPDVKDIVSKYHTLSELDKIRGPPTSPNWVGEEQTAYWDHARFSCAPSTPSRSVGSMEDFSDNVEFPADWPSYSYHGYVQNFTQSQDICVQPHLHSTHGTFAESISMSTSHELVPVFGGSKMLVNNDILIPGAMYLSEDHRYNANSLPNSVAWSAKKDSLMWRGVASGGRNRATSWHHFHRHRFVQAMNATAVELAEKSKLEPQAFRVPRAGLYDVAAQREGRLAEWLSEFSDVAFVNLECYPSEYEGTKKNKRKSARCSYTDPHFAIAPAMDLATQFNYKYLPDIDGNSFSGRWRSFLHSTSLPMKSTIYAEWHDDRLAPWIHFVPFDNSYQDLYGIMDYFLSGRDSAAERIATEGRLWAQRVLRREDMLLYVWRLLLEFARICDDERVYLGFVGDLGP
jgi:hypothetical protein